MESPIVRPAVTVADYIACQHAQRMAWGLVDESYVVPLATMVGAQHHGGLVLGAFLSDGTATGLSFAFMGQVDRNRCLYSQLTGVIPGYQGQGIGGRLKAFQRAYARSMELEFIAWSFDPLQAGNAFFNLHRLGASSNRIIENMYGFRTDALNAGVPTDRMIVEWPTEAGLPRPARTRDPGWPHLVRGDEGPTVVPINDLLDHQTVLVEIPQDISEIRANSPTLAELWRVAISQSLAKAFLHHYRAVDVVRDERRSFYVLERS